MAMPAQGDRRMSKGSWRRPSNVLPKHFEESWDRIFGDSEASAADRKAKMKVSGVPYEVEAEKVCCNGDCNQGRDCPLRKDQ